MAIQSEPERRDSTKGKSNSQTKRVNFSTIAIDAFNMELSVNPGSTMGPSIGLGRELVYKKIRRLSSFDNERQYTRRRKKGGLELYLSPNTRNSILAQSYSKQEIKRSVKKKDALRRSNAAANFFLSPTTRLSSMFRYEVQRKKLGRANSNLKALHRDGHYFFCHEEIYRGWMLQPVYR